MKIRKTHNKISMAAMSRDDAALVWNNETQELVPMFFDPSLEIGSPRPVAAMLMFCMCMDQDGKATFSALADLFEKMNGYVGYEEMGGQ